MSLYLIPVPLCEEGIGDIPARTLATIEKITYFLVENERSARRFLTQCKLSKPIQEITVISIEDKNNIKWDELLSPLLQDRIDCGLMSEAGVPCLADPGAEIIKRAHELGIAIHPLAGPSSIYLALSASGFNGQEFSFHGYLPKEPQERKSSLLEIEKSLKTSDKTHIFIETPYRNDNLFQTILETCDGEIKLCLALDLTSPKEEIHSFSINNWRKRDMKIGKRPAIFLLGR